MSNVFDVRTFTPEGEQEHWAYGVRPTFTDELFETNGVLQVEVEKALPAAGWLTHGTEVALFMNGRELPDSRAVLDEKSDAETDASDVMGRSRAVKWSGRTLMSQLETATVYPEGWPDDVEGGHTFGTATPGEVMRTLILRAQARGALMHPQIEMDFTGAADSAGVPWEKSLVGLGFEAGVSLKTALDAIMRLGAGEPRMVGRTLQLFNPDGIGVDRTTGSDPIVLRRSSQVIEQPQNESSQGIANAYLVRGDDGVVFERVDEASVEMWGRREAHLSQQNMGEGTLTILADAALSRTAGMRGEYSAKVIDRPGTPQPFSDFQKGDWVWLEQEGRVARYRVRQMSATPDASSRLTESGVTLNDKFAELDMLMAKRMEGVTGAGSQETVQPIDPDRTPTFNPKPPEGIGGTSYTYWDNGQYKVSVVLSWVPVTERTNGHALDSILRYDVFRRPARLNDDDEWVAEGNWQKVTEVEEAQVSLDGYDPSSSWWFTVKALDQYRKRSEYGEPALIHMTRDETPPPVPSRLTVEYQMGWPIIAWDGRDEDDAPMVLGDFDGIQVAQVIGAEHDVKVVLRDASTYVPHGLTVNEPATFVARSFDHAEPRNYSDWSLPLSVMPRPLVEGDVIGSVIDDWQEGVDDRIRDIIDNVIPGATGNVEGMLQALIAQIERRGGTTWVQDTPPPAGTFYRWTGEPGNSTSEKVEDGEVVATNPPDDSFDGDSKDDRANDLWVNTAEGNKPYTWDSETKEWGEVSDDRITDLVNRLDSVVSEYVVEYAVGDSYTDPPTSGWSEDTPTTEPGVLVWFRAVITYADGHTVTTAPAPLTGPPGGKGDPGPGGVSIISVTPWFVTVGDGSSPPPKPTQNPPSPWEGWQNTEPPYQPDTDLYRTECIEFDNGDFQFTTVTRVASYEGIRQVRALAITADKRVQAGLGPPTLADGEGAPEGAIYWEYAESGARQVLVGVWRWTGEGWVTAPLDRQIIPLLDIGSGTFGDLDGIRLKANSVATKALVVADRTNHFTDPEFEEDYAPWVKDDGGIKKSGGEPAGGFYDWTTFAVAPGEKLVAGVTVAREDGGISKGTEASGDYSVRVQYQRPNGAWQYLDRLIQSNQTGEVQSEVPVEVPPGVTRMRLGFYTETNMPTDSTVRLSNLWVRKQSGSVLIEDGAVTADKVVVSQELWAKIAEFVEVTAGMIKAQQIEAQHLTAVIALLSRVVAGDPDGAAAEMDQHGFKVYAKDDATGARYEVTSLGTSSDDTLAIRGSDGRVIAGIDNAGHGSFVSASIGEDPEIMGRMLFGAFGDPDATDDSWLMDLPQGVLAAGETQPRVVPVNGHIGIGDIAFTAPPLRNLMIANSSGRSLISQIGNSPTVYMTHRWTMDGSQPRFSDSFTRGFKHWHPSTEGQYLGMDWVMFHETWPGWDPIENSQSNRLPSGVPLRMLTTVQTIRCQAETFATPHAFWVRVFDMGRYVESSTNVNDGGIASVPSRQIYRTYWEASSHRAFNNLGIEGHAPTAAQLGQGRTSYSPQWGLRSAVALFTAANGKKATSAYPGHANMTMDAALSGRSIKAAWVQLWVTETNYNRAARLQMSSYPSRSLPSRSPTTAPTVGADISPNSWINVRVPNSWFDTTSKRGILTRSGSTAIDHFARYAGSGDTNGRRPRVILEYQ